MTLLISGESSLTLDENNFSHVQKDLSYLYFISYIPRGQSIDFPGQYLESQFFPSTRCGTGI